MSLSQRFSIVLTLSLTAVAALRAQGPLTPPGPPAPVMKSLDQIEPRTPISSLPFVITQPGSYYFTQNLHFSDATGHAITIQVSNVTLDLNGFTLSSAAAVTGNGVHVAPGLRNHRIRNGSITGTTVVTVTLIPAFSVTAVKGGFENGIRALDACQASDLTLTGCRSTGFEGAGSAVCENLHLEHNGVSGAAANNVSTIRNSTASRNVLFGISGFGSVQGCSVAYNGSFGLTGCETVADSYAHFNAIGISGGSIQNCTVSGSAGTGISAATVSQCHAISNGGAGISAETISHCSAVKNGGKGFGLDDPGATIQNSRAFDNAGAGIQAVEGCTVMDNTCSENAVGITVTTGCTVSGNTCVSNIGHGISAGSENQIRGNTCDKNGTGAAAGAGIHTTGGDNRIDSNACTENDRGLHITNSGSIIVRNTCASNSLVNYEIAATNRVGLIVTATTSAAISGSSGGAGVGSDNPWSNFSF